MTQIYFPFDAGPGSTVLEAQWTRMAREWRPTGIIPNILDQCEVVAPGTGLAVNVRSGRAWIEGHLWESDATESFALAAAHPSLPRIDRIVLRLDWTNNSIALAVLQGTPAASPVPPSLTQTSALWEISLAQVSIPAGATAIGASNLTDERPWASGYGAVRMPSLASATTLPLSTTGYNSPRLLVLPVTGSSDISNIPILPAGTWLLLEFAAALRVVASSTLLLNGVDYRAPAGGQLLLVSTGVAWREVARSAPLAASTGANQIFAGPASGAAAAPAFRALALADLPQAPQALVTRATAVAISSGTGTTLTFDTVRWNIQNVWSSANPTRLTAPIAGLYYIWSNISFQANATGRRQVYFNLSGVGTIAVQILPSVTEGVATVLQCSALYRLAANDYVECVVFQSSGTSLDVEVTSYSPLFGMVWLGP